MLDFFIYILVSDYQFLQKNPAGVLITIRLHSKLNLGEINIFAVVSLPIHESSIFISSLMSLSDSFLVLV